MDSNADSRARQFKWHIAVILGALLVVALLAVFTSLFENTAVLRDLVFLLGSVVFLIALLIMLARVSGIVNTLRENSDNMEAAAKALENIHAGLKQINHSTRVSEIVKTIAFREEEKQSLREAVFERLKDGDFDGAYEIIDEIGGHSGYRTLSEELRREVDQYRDAPEDERLDQAIAYINSLLDGVHWAKASVQIEAMIRAHPASEKARAMRQQLIDKKEQHKRSLLTDWDNAVKRQETDRSLEILHELDMYLTPNEALALQEAAKDVFRTKLHNLGVQFAMAVSDKQWTDALDVGQRIIRDFPNSRMSVEIREKLHVLQQNVQMQNS
ncbi:MAG: hypothetical protein A2Y77_01295 [Planctomycetes bacterium RBG_13_62_9]|nr:MAG: hypothetical protein A2Y77_01295 [Planctomycetes bacterium RBG_13_62_9]